MYTKDYSYYKPYGEIHNVHQGLLILQALWGDTYCTPRITHTTSPMGRCILYTKNYSYYKTFYCHIERCTTYTKEYSCYKTYCHIERCTIYSKDYSCYKTFYCHIERSHHLHWPRITCATRPSTATYKDPTTYTDQGLLVLQDLLLPHRKIPPLTLTKDYSCCKTFYCHIKISTTYTDQGLLMLQDILLPHREMHHLHRPSTVTYRAYARNC